MKIYFLDILKMGKLQAGIPGLEHHQIFGSRFVLSNSISGRLPYASRECSVQALSSRDL